MALNNVYLYVFLFFVSIAWIKFFIQKLVQEKREKKEYPIRLYTNKILQSVNNMTGSQFEDFVEYIYKSIGYKVKATPKTRDGGKDLIIYTNSGKIYVEVKRYESSSLITSSLVLKLIGSAASDGVKKCIFLTTSGFTKDAIKTANNSKIKVDLIDIEGFLDICKQCNQNKVLNYLKYT